MARQRLIAGNWKMNGLGASLAELDVLIAAGPLEGVDVLLCPPATLIAAFATRAAGTHVAIGAQDCHARPSGAHTGDISAPMLADAGAVQVILGHSERRADHGENDALVKAKALAAREAGLGVIVCVGETLDEREAGRTLGIVGRQLANSVPDSAVGLTVAYEPVWAIGTGLTPTLEQIAEVHDALRADLEARFGPAGAEVRILYGGSVKPGNAAGIFALGNVDGGLVGGASLQAEDFLGIIGA